MGREAETRRRIPVGHDALRTSQFGQTSVNSCVFVHQTIQHSVVPFRVSFQLALMSPVDAGRNLKLEIKTMLPGRTDNVCMLH